MRRLPGKEAGWLKTWDEEIVPAMLYADRHLGLDDDTKLQLTTPNLPAADVLLDHGAKVERLEITVAFAKPTTETLSEAQCDPRYQEALRSEVLNVQGWVSSYTPLIRDKVTREITEADEGVAQTVEQRLDEWAEGLGIALKKKKRAAYGNGSTLLVYGDGMSGDFSTMQTRYRLDDLLRRLTSADLDNCFDSTIIMGWHQGWIARFASGRLVG